MASGLAVKLKILLRQVQILLSPPTSCRFVPGNHCFDSSATLVYGQLIYLLPLGSFNVSSLVEFFRVALKRPKGKGSIREPETQARCLPFSGRNP